MEILSCFARTLTTAPQISSPSSNCSPIIPNSFNQNKKQTLNRMQKKTEMEVSFSERKMLIQEITSRQNSNPTIL
jgi:hypothetical protein